MGVAPVIAKRCESLLAPTLDTNTHARHLAKGGNIFELESNVSRYNVVTCACIQHCRSKQNLRFFPKLFHY